MLRNFFNETVIKADLRIATSKQDASVRLDKNEQTSDVSDVIKDKVLEALKKADWNRYPDADYKVIESKIAQYCGLMPENIVLSSGSASIITTLLDYFAINRKSLIIAQPSYSLFEYHCKTYGIHFEPWLMQDDLTFSEKNLPDLDENSVLILTSPNNPTGTCIEESLLEKILFENPQTMVVLDGVYTEFADINLTPLMLKYSNLIVLRSFSKAFPIAGLRLGYLCANAATASVVRKLILQFSIAHFSLIFAKEILFEETFMKESFEKVACIKSERQRMSKILKARFEDELIQVYPSQGNFLLIKIKNEQAFNIVLEDLKLAGIKVLNAHNFVLLKQCIRVSIGSIEENQLFLQTIERSLENFFINLEELKVDSTFSIN